MIDAGVAALGSSGRVEETSKGDRVLVALIYEAMALRQTVTPAMIAAGVAAFSEINDQRLGADPEDIVEAIIEAALSR